MPLLRYERLEEIGRGGMGIVYRCRDRLTQGVIALKSVLTSPAPPDPRLRLRLAQEFNTLASLYHPNVIRVLDYGFDDQGFPFFTMDYIPNARTLVEAGQAARTPDEQIRLLIDLLNALAYLHRRGIVHRDLKPANVLVDAAGHVLVLDFGVALQGHRKEAEAIAGTVAFMAPEMLKQQAISPRSDLFALGVLAFQMLTGEHPFDVGSTPRTIINIINQPADLDRIRPPRLRAIVGRLLAKDSTDRYPSAEAVIEALAAAAVEPINLESPTLRESYLTASTFVGREHELAQLEGALAATMEGKGQAWLIAGESGVGKSRLLHELRIRALVKGAVVLLGQGVEGGGAPYQLWRQAAGQLALAVEPTLEELGTLADLLPAHHPALEGKDPLTDGRSTDVAVVLAQMLKRMPGPLVILMEDLQWAIESLHPLTQLMDSISTLPILIVGTYRSDEVSSPPLPEASLIPLKRLDREAIKALSVSMIGQSAADPSLITYLTQQTEGNAFFLVEVVRELADEAGRLSHIAEMTLPERVISQGVQTIVQRRLARVPQAHQPLLKVAAVLGRHIDIALLSRVTEKPIDAWLAACTAASVVEAAGDTFRFSHDKLREGLLEALTPQERQTLNRQAALALEQHHPDDTDQAARLARHWQAAGDAAKEQAYRQAAAKRSDEVGAWRDALSQYERLRDLTPPDDIPTDTRLLIEIGIILNRAAQYERSEPALRQALTRSQQLGNIMWQVEVLENLADIAYMNEQLDESERVARSALALLDGQDEPLRRARLYTVLGRVAWQRGDYAAMLHADRAYLDLLLAQQASPERIIAAYNNVGYAALHNEDYTTAETSLRDALGLSDKVNGSLTLIFVQLNLAEVYRRTRRPAPAWPLVRKGLQAYRSLRLDYLALEALTIAAGLRGIEGSPAAGLLLLAQIETHSSVDVEIRAIMDKVKADLITLDGEASRPPPPEPANLDTLTETVLAYINSLETGGGH